MTALADIDDLTIRLGRDLYGADLIKAHTLLEDASAAVRAYTGQQFTLADLTSRLRVSRGKVRLPQRPVTAIDSVDDVDGNALAYTWDAGDIIYLATSSLGPAYEFTFVPRITPVMWVDVTYTAGYETVPDEIVAVVCEKVRRSLDSPVSGAVTSQTMGDASQSFGAVGAAGIAGFFSDEREVLDRYRRVGGSIRIG
jgi:hypothetical protein